MKTVFQKEKEDWIIIEGLIDDFLKEYEVEQDEAVADSQESVTEYEKKEDNAFADRQELCLSCYSIEKKRNIQQFNISGETKGTTTDNNIQIDLGDVISANSIVFDGSVANDIVIGKSADTFRGGTYSYYLKDLTQTNAYADCYQQENYYQLTTAEVIETEAKSESPVYGTFQAQDSDRIKRVFNQVLKLELRYEDNEEQETQYCKFIFEEAMRGNPEISALAGAIENRAMSVTGG